MRPGSSQASRDRAIGPQADVVRRGLLSRATRLAILAAAPVVIFIAHFFYGAILPLPALILLTILSACAIVGLAPRSSRLDMARLTPVWPVVAPFVLVLLVAAWTLTATVPGGPHPIWDWAGLPPASTLNRSATIIEIIKLMGLAAVFVLGCLLGARSARARAALGLILAVGGVYAIVSLVQFVGRGQVLSGDRLGGGFDLANVAGTQFGVLVVLGASWAAHMWGRASHATLISRLTDIAPAMAATLLFSACLILTASRAAIGITALAIMLFIGWAALDARRGRWPLMASGVALIAVALVLVLQGNTLFVDRFGDVAQGEATRSILRTAHWKAFLDAPLLGYGLGSYPEVNNQVMTVANAEALGATTVLHNVYLQWLEEAGVIGATPMFAVVAVVLGVTAWRMLRRSRNRVLLAGLLTASALVLMHAAFDVSLNTPSFQAFWTLLLGLGFALSQAPSRS